MARLGRTYDRILEVVAQVETGTPADVALKNVFKKARDLGSRERSEVSETVYGILRRKRTIEDRLERAAKAEKRIPRALERIIGEKLPNPKRSDLEELAIEISLPTFVVSRLLDA